VRFYQKVVNQARAAPAYDRVLAEADLLMPTSPMLATPLPAPDAPSWSFPRATEMMLNTQPSTPRTTGAQHLVRQAGRPAGRHDADRPALRGGDALPRRPCLRAVGGLASLL
jgi:hypothetical protein